jgi:hypothetical protein
VLHALSVAFKLSRRGLRTICVPKSLENDVAATALAFGFNTALSYTTDTAERIRTYWLAMILIGAPSIVSGNETIAPTPLTAVSPTSLAW